MGLFNREKKTSIVRCEMVTEKGNGFYSWGGKLYHSDIVRSCIRPKAQAVGKLVGKHIQETADGVKVNAEPYMRFLLEEPNPHMTGQMMQEKLTVQLALNGNAFAAIIRDEAGFPMELYPIPATGADAIYDAAGNLYLKFYFQNGKSSVFRYEDVIHLRRDYASNDIFGTSSAKALSQLMEVVNTTDQGLVRAVRNSGIVRWLLKYTTTMRDEDLKQHAKEFSENYLTLENDQMGVAATDGRAEAQRIEPKDYVPNAMLIDRTTSRIFSFFNTNEKIVQSKFTEEEWNSYYEAEVEPVAIQLANEYTRKLFSRKQRGHGNRIYFEGANLQWASLSTKLGFSAMVDRGAMTPNEWRHMFWLAPVEGGDKPIRRLDTATVEGGGNE